MKTFPVFTDKCIFKLAVGILLLAASFLLLAIFFTNDDVFIESQESKTITGAAVYNKIRWIKAPNKDIWMMQQSHHGKYTNPSTWDRIAIVIDKKQSPKVARFYQLEPGELEWKEPIPAVQLKATCFRCHSNGLRMIRPNYASSLHKHTWIEQMKIFFWNLRIKSYGRIVPDPYHDQQDPNLGIPFRMRSSFDNEALKVKTCIKCHKEKGMIARGALFKQNSETIRSMLSFGHMPPLLLSLPEAEKKELAIFLNGLQE